jgi:hypothetical protein
MKAIVSTTHDDRYLFFLPIITWCWNKLGVDVICFLPTPDSEIFHSGEKMNLIQSTPPKFTFHPFKAPRHKQATYAQCSRLYAAALDLPEGEVLITSDIDMAVFKVPPYYKDVFIGTAITIFGADLVPEGQYPMCYASATARDWRRIMRIVGKDVQECLDEQLAHEEMENMRGNLWCRDQELLFKHARNNIVSISRARPGTQFASNRVDRDDSFWRDRLNHDVIDAHLWRPGYEDENFEKIIELIQFFYPHDDLTWMREYQKQYKALL